MEKKFDQISKKRFLYLSGSKLFGNKKFLSEAFDFLFEHFPEEYGKYILVDVSQQSSLPRNMQARSRIFPDENNEIKPVFFFPKST